jgi:DNA-binding phage protein
MRRNVLDLEMERDRWAAMRERASAGDEGAETALLIEAGNGSLGALRTLRDGILSEPNGLSPENLMKVEVVARILSALGNPEDVRQCATILWLCGMVHHTRGLDDGAHIYGVDALKLYRALADNGDGLALQALASCAQILPDAWAEVERELTPDDLTVMAAARRMRDEERPAQPAEDPGAALQAWLDSFPPLTRWERVKLYFVDIGWAFRMLGWSIQGVGKDVLHLCKTIIGRGWA